MNLMSLVSLAVSVDGRWRPGIGDPSVMGWVTVAAYIVAALLCWRCASRAGLGGSYRAGCGERATWLLLAAAMLFLGVNKQLDLQSWVTQVGEDFVRAHHLSKRAAQTSFAVGVLAAGVAALAVVLWLARRVLRRMALALVGVLFLVCFVAVRLVSLHSVDRMLGTRFAGAKLNWILELAGIACVGLCAWWHLCRGGRRRRRVPTRAPGRV